MFTKSPLDATLNHLNQKERMEAIKLKEQVKLFKQDEDENHPNIIKLGDRVSKKVNMGDYTVASPTKPIATSMYPKINEHPTQYSIFKTMKESYICCDMTFCLLKLCLSLQIWTYISLFYNCVHFTNCNYYVSLSISKPFLLTFEFHISLFKKNKN